MASGLDTQTLINDMMNVERSRYVTPLERQKQMDVWKREAYQQFSKQMADYMLEMQEKMQLSRLGQTGSPFKKDVNDYSWGKKASSSDEKIATATSSAAAINGVMDVNITQLAEGVTRYGKQLAELDGDDVGTSSTLAEIFADTDFEVDGDGNKHFSFDINGRSIKVLSTDSVGEVLDKVNNPPEDDPNMEIDVKLYFIDGRFTLGTKETGADKKILITNDNKSFMSGGAGGLLGIDLTSGTEVAGKNAEATFGGTVDRESSTNDITFNGVTIKATTTGSVKVTTEPNVDGIIDIVKEFVNGYNEIVDDLNKTLGEKKNREYYALTDEEAKDLGEDQSKKWNDEAKKGMFRNNIVLSNITSTMRSHMYQEVYTDYEDDKKNSFNMITKIGITTGKYTQKGKLEIDEQKLKDAIIEDTEGVLNLLFKAPSSDVMNLDDDKILAMNSSDPEKGKALLEKKYAEMGVFNRMFSDLTNGIKEIVNEAGYGEDAATYREVKSNIFIDFVTKKSGSSNLDNDIEDLVLKIYEEERRLSSVEEGYWTKYSRLEKTMQGLNSQSQWLASQLANL